MTFRPELIDELLKDYQCPDDLMGEGGIFKQLTKAVVERCLSAELDHHLIEEKTEPEVNRPKNRRNGASKKTIKGEFGEAEIVTVPSSPSSLRRTRPALQALMARFCRCMP